MAVGGYVAAETLLPVPGMDGLADKGGAVTLAYVMMIPSLGLALGVGQCANPNGSIGISRALTAMLAYDIPFILVIFGAAYVYGTTNLADIIAIQQQHGPGGWGVVQMPLLAIAGMLTLPAIMGKHPYEIYVAPAEIATGPMWQVHGRAVRHAVFSAVYRRRAVYHAVSGWWRALADLSAEDLCRGGVAHGHRLRLSALPH
jgi:NADH-quinone oxidoreductase subunit H